jgi:hypothetical protein
MNDLFLDLGYLAGSSYEFETEIKRIWVFLC